MSPGRGSKDCKILNWWDWKIVRPILLLVGMVVMVMVVEWEKSVDVTLCLAVPVTGVSTVEPPKQVGWWRSTAGPGRPVFCQPPTCQDNPDQPALWPAVKHPSHHVPTRLSRLVERREESCVGVTSVVRWRDQPWSDSLWSVMSEKWAVATPAPLAVGRQTWECWERRQENYLCSLQSGVIRKLSHSVGQCNCWTQTWLSSAQFASGGTRRRNVSNYSDNSELSQQVSRDFNVGVFLLEMRCSS